MFPPRPPRPSSPALILALPCAAALLVALAACTPAQRAQQSMHAGDPVRAAHLYRQALSRDPDDPQLRARHEAAQIAAANLLARQAHDALSAGRDQQAVSLARQAAQLHPTHRATEARIRHAIARRRLDSARQHLDRAVFDLARVDAQAAQAIAHDLPEAPAMLERIDRAQADVLAADARAFADVGRFDRADALARRAANLNPHDPALASLPHDIDTARRARRFDQLIAQARTDLAAGRLQATSTGLAQLAALDVRHDDLQQLTDAFDARQLKLDNALQDARDARTRGDFTDALRHYALAASLTADRDLIDQEQHACQTDRLVAALLREADLASQQGDHQHAADAYRQALDHRADPQTQTALRNALAAFHRKALYQALERDERTVAIDHLQQLLRHDPDETSQRILYRLHVELADAALTRATQLHNERHTEQALDVLDHALQYADDPRMTELRRSLLADLLTRRAVAAEKAGDFPLAHSLYLDALEADPAQHAIAQRLDDVQSIARLQQQIRDLQSDLAAREQTLREHQRTIDALRADLQYWHDRAQR